MLKFYESFQQYKVPSSLANQIIDGNGNVLEKIENINKINIFIGPNNSGKSKILRELLKENNSRYYSKLNWNAISSLIVELYDFAILKSQELIQYDKLMVSNGQFGKIIDVVQFEEVKKNATQYSANFDLEPFINSITNQFINLPKSLTSNLQYLYIVEQQRNQLGEQKVLQLLSILNEIKDLALETVDKLIKYKFSEYSKANFSKVYIPSIRTLREFGSKANIKSDTKKEYQFDESVFIFNGQSLPEEIFKLTNSKFSLRQKLFQFEKLLSDEFFESQEVKLTYEREEKVLLIKIGNEMERPIHELGDGLQMIIILTFPFFENRSGIIVIEEPELFIHPGLQKTFVKFLISNPVTENFQIFISSHSNHIIDSINSSDSVSLFSINKREKPDDKSLEKIPDLILENSAYGNQNLLNLLGISTTSVYLSNCIIWVEGITDKIYIQKFIACYLESLNSDSDFYKCKKFQEGTNYSFALTGGDSIIHWDFDETNEYSDVSDKIIVDKFCAKSLVIVDNDFGKLPARKSSLKKLLDNRFIELDVPEIENLLPMSIVNSIILEYPSVKKAINSNTLEVLPQTVVKDKKMGAVIDELILNQYKNVKSFSSSSENGSLKSSDKFDFCKKANNYLNKNNLTNDAVILVEKILAFVMSKNN